MTKTEMENRLHMYRALERLGFTADERDALRRISMTLRRWAERECNGEIERDDDTGKPFERVGYARNAAGDSAGYSARYPVADREAGALRRLSAIMATRKRRLIAYHQGDPRGAALYIVKRKQLPKGADVSSYCSSRGVAVY